MLGVLIDENIAFDSVFKRFNVECGITWKFRRYLSSRMLLFLLNASVFSKSDYCLLIWDPKRENDLSNLQKCINSLSVCLFCLNVSKFYSERYTGNLVFILSWQNPQQLNVILSSKVLIIICYYRNVTVSLYRNGCLLYFLYRL